MNNQKTTPPATPQPARSHTPAEESAIKEKAAQIQQKTAEAAEEAKRQAADLSQRAKSEASTTLQNQKEMAAQELHGVAEALRQTGSQLQGQEQNLFAQYSHQMANQVDRASNYLEEHDLEELVHEAEDFARRQPELFIGGAFTLGLLAARFWKSSAPSDYDRSMAETGRPYTYRYSVTAEPGRYDRPR